MLGRKTPRSTRKTFLRLIQFFGPYRWAFLAVIILAICSTLMETFSPAILGQATTLIADGLQHGTSQAGLDASAFDFDQIEGIILTCASLYLVSGIVRYFQDFILSRTVSKTIADLRQAMQIKLNRLPISRLDSLSNGEILSRAINDVENIARTLQQNISQAIISITQFICVTIMVLSLSYKIGGMMVLSVFIALFVVSRLTPITQRLFADRQCLQGRLNDLIEEDYNGQMEIKAFNQEDYHFDRFKEQTAAYNHSSQLAEFISGILFPSVNFIRNLNYVAIAFAGGAQVLQGKMPIGNVQALLQYNPQLYLPIASMANIFNQIQSTLASAERVFEFLDLEEMNFDAEITTPIRHADRIEFDHVYFGYHKNHPILKDFHLDVHSGQTIAIVGPTGAGKTTLINLLERFYEVNDGAIKIDGQDIRHLSREALRHPIGMVLQDAWLFNGSIYDNIAYGAQGREIHPEEVYAAAKTAHVDEFVHKLPDGYQTLINESASNLSQGQRQLITIARALVSQPDILILDEATSSIDTRTESLIQKATTKLLEGRTAFVIAHRLSTIQDADIILVLNQGQIIEKGNHQDLLAKKGFYYQLYHAQFDQAS